MGDTRTLGLDIGDRWTGVALSDPGGILATPLLIIDRKEAPDDVGAVLDLLRKHEVTRVVVGMPGGLDGVVGRQAAKVQNFADRLSRVTDIAIEFCDERLSTVSAAAYLREAGGKKRRRGARDDAAAAAVILQGYLDEHRARSEDDGNDRPSKPA